MIANFGLKPSEKVIQATKNYKDESDKFSEFISDCLIKDVNEKVRTAEVYSEYQGWCARNGYCIENIRNLNQALRAYGQIKKCRPSSNSTVTNMLIGYKLRYDDFSA